MSTPALRLADAHSTNGLDANKAEAFIQGISDRIDQLGEIVDIAGDVNDVVRGVFSKAARIHDVAVAAEQMIRSNQSIAACAERAQGSAVAVKEGLASATGAIREGLASAHENVATLSEAATQFSAILQEATATVQRVSESSAAINSVAREIQLIAINAGVEAARSGAAGRGFAVIANAVKDLAEQTRAATAENARQLAALAETIEKLCRQSQDSEAKARAATADNASVAQRLAAFDEFGQSVHRLVADIEGISTPVAENIRVCGAVTDHLDTLVDELDESRSSYREAAQRIDSLVRTSQELVAFIAGSAVQAKDGKLIRAAQEAAAEISRLLEKAVDEGAIGLHDLFDEDYRPVPGSDPQQHLTRFTTLTDRLLPPVQEPLLSLDPRIVFCAAVDRNGYLPTHNRMYSKPLSPDPVWNAANCRNRRIFDDRTGLSAGRNTQRFLVQTYRRDMGGGQFALMKDVSAPIRVKGRHWGGFRIGVKV
ncbi:chemotaxis protein [Alsobacter soli]|uniref:Chemotaxis protein n=1 Tax=Alsobacter soli TaxID=2109933 RepID=A0A2T1HYA7_9HYPH|nr:methyl-accepting chemotaxis protein [Alsobacter soli]PSC06677.1 chemotaxis protein [Alsobacter soli]